MLKKAFPGFYQLGSQKARFSTSSIFNRLLRSKMPDQPGKRIKSDGMDTALSQTGI
jgi:hypothetical protein